jgi:AdoMet-dependent heme synthase
MIGLLEEMTAKALKLNIPLSVQLDLTYRCNERCVHCYLDHHDHGEMTTAEIKHLMDEMAEAGVFILTLSGGEIFLRKDFFELLEYARRERMFCVKLKTNAILIHEREAARIRDLGVESVQISIYSHRAEVHDAITLIPGSLKRSVDAIRFLKSQGLRVVIANVLMVQNMQDYKGVRALAEELGVECTLDPTITPMMDGDREVLNLGIGNDALRQVFRDAALVGDVDEFCAISTNPDEDALENLPCSAGHTACYVSPYGDVFPCVQFPLPTGNVRKQHFLDIWRHSEQMNDVRSIRVKDLSTCTSCSHVSSCTRCPGLAYLEGNMRGPSSQDCQKSFARTGVPSANMLAKQRAAENLGQKNLGQSDLGQSNLPSANLVQIRALPVSARTPVTSATA